jgi:hypothetical protein
MKQQRSGAQASRGQKRAPINPCLGLLLALGAAGALVACGSAGGDSDIGIAAAGAGGEAGLGEAGSAAVPAPLDGGTGGADGSPEPGADTCRPTNKAEDPDDEFTDSNCDGIDGDAERAIFVSPDGFDSDDGSIKRPVQSIGQAVLLAKDDGLAVYVCNGTYRENVVIDSPVSIYGGFDCTRGWRRAKDIAILQAGAGLPLLVKNVDGKVHLERLAFRAPDAVGAGQSSQAAAIVGSNDVSLAQVELKAGRGTSGVHGTSGANAYSSPPRSSARGAATITSDCYAPDAGGSPGAYCDSFASGGYSATATQLCAGGFEMRGGRGGAGANVWLAKGKPVCFKKGSSSGETPFLGEYRDGAGSWTYVSSAKSGASGAQGADGAAAAFGVGSMADGVYAATNAGSDGAPGQPGWPGRGGGGGLSAGHSGDVCGSDYRVGSGGGQGGLGGCGGGRATGGTGGGGSVALVVIDSTVTIAGARISVGDGGAGGDGAPGGSAQPGASGASGGAAQSSVYQGASGQAGGYGGPGGDGGPGGGGPSIAILYQGAAPQVDEVVYEIGVPGDGGQAYSGPNGPAGATGEVMSLDEIVGEKS